MVLDSLTEISSTCCRYLGIHDFIFLTHIFSFSPSIPVVPMDSPDQQELVLPGNRALSVQLLVTQGNLYIY